MLTHEETNAYMYIYMHNQVESKTWHALTKGI